MSIYDILAPFYARFNDEVDYEKMADYADGIMRQYFPGKSLSILDLGCGSGNVTLPLLNRGYDMIGLDGSEEMLSVARERAGGEQVLWLCQDMRSFELYGTVEGVVCTLDGINHLLSKKDVLSCFSLVHNYLVPNGIFIFDVNTPYKFETVYGNASYVFEEEGVFCCWQNDYRKKSGRCYFAVDLFTEDADGRYARQQAEDAEQVYTEKQIGTLLSEAGFSLLSVTDGYSNAPKHEKSERLTFVARAIK